MPKFTVQQKTSLAPDDAFRRIKDFILHDKDLRRLDSNYTCEFNDSAQTGQASGKTFSATLKLQSENRQCNVEIEVELPFALSLFKGKIQKILTDKLETTLTDGQKKEI